MKAVFSYTLNSSGRSACASLDLATVHKTIEALVGVCLDGVRKPVALQSGRQFWESLKDARGQISRIRLMVQFRHGFCSQKFADI